MIYITFFVERYKIYDKIKYGDDKMKPVVLCILDGMGVRSEENGNAIKLANTPNLKYLWNKYSHSLLEASSEYVGLLHGQMGNSEVGHLNIGAGRIVYQPSQLINECIKNKTFFENKELLDVIKHVNTNNSKLHIMGLVSDSGVHSLMGHFKALIQMAKDNNVKKLYFHAFSDGRDTLPKEANFYITQLENYLKEIGLGKIATVSGRYYAMDRDNNWERIKKAYDVIVNGLGEKFNSPEEIINYNYDKNITDEFVEPAIIDEDGTIGDNDGIIWGNYRGDRAREILTAITNSEFKEFKARKFNNIKLVTMMPVANTVINTHAYQLDEIKNTLGDYISSLNLKQLRIAETEKYAHVTYFFDGGLDKEIKGCDRILIHSPKVATYDMKPEMSCEEITNNLLSVIEKYDVIILNYANGDMVGHTGNLEAAIKAVEVVDYNLGRLYTKCKELGIIMFITADHGNCEEMIDENGNILTSHTTNKVPFMITDEKYTVKDGKLGDIAPTILKVMNIDIPKEMTGDILIVD